MGIFSRFRRDRDESLEPGEVQDYYESENGQRQSVSIFLGLVTFIVTLLLLIGLFLGGRAIYRAITTDDAPETVQTDNNSAEQQAPAPSEDQPNQDQNRDNNQDSSTDQMPSTGDTTLPATGDPGM